MWPLVHGYDGEGHVCCYLLLRVELGEPIRGRYLQERRKQRAWGIENYQGERGSRGPLDQSEANLGQDWRGSAGA